MAILIGLGPKRFQVSLSIDAIDPFKDGHIDAYEVKFSLGEEVVIENIYNLKGTMMRHYHMLRIAEVFWNSRNLIGKKVDFSGEYDRSYKQKLFVSDGSDWLEVFSCSVFHEGEDKVLAYIFIQNMPCDSYFRSYTRLVVMCSLDEAVNFGYDLASAARKNEDDNNRYQEAMGNTVGHNT